MNDGSDQAAIEAGKLLVKEITTNLDDKTGLTKEVILKIRMEEILIRYQEEQLIQLEVLFNSLLYRFQIHRKQLLK